MKIKLTISVKKRNQPQWLIWLIIMMPFMFGTLLDLFALPSALKYLLDVSWTLLTLFLVIRVRNRIIYDKRSSLFFLVGTFFVYVSVVYILNYQSVFYFLWGIRNNFRYYVFFFACTEFLRKEDIDDYFHVFDILFWINICASLVQHFMFGYRADWLGGIFGTQTGVNAYTNLFFVIMSAKTVVRYLNKAEKMGSCIAKCGAMVIVAALAEIKFFYLEFILIVAMAILLADFSWRKLAATLGCICVILGGYYLLIVLFPGSRGFLSIESILKIAASDRGYTSSGDMNRLTALMIISNRFLTTPIKQLFGMGLGNCDSAGYAFLTTPFYNRYSNLRYHWFSHAVMYLETGLIGLSLYGAFFVLIIRESTKKINKTKKQISYNQIVAITAVCCLLTAVYNSSLRTEAGYMVYFVMAIPFINENTHNGIEDSVAKCLAKE